MAMEAVYCHHCNGTGKEQRDVGERSVRCDLGFVHTYPVIKAGSNCRECGGTGTVMEPNFGRQ